MSDHWNSLANLLGTPSIDPLQRKPVADVKPDLPEKKREEGPRHDRDVATKKPTLPELEIAAEESSPAARAEPPSRIRASWDAVARLFGVNSAADSASPTASTSESSSSDAPSTRENASPNSNDDLFAGFRGRGDRQRSSGRDTASDSHRPASAPPSSQSSERRPNEQRRDSRGEARSSSGGEISKPTSRKRPPSVWDTQPAVDSDREVSPAAIPADEPRVSKERDSERPPYRDRSDASIEGEPERRGRRRNIRRGHRDDEPQESRRESSESSTSNGREPLPNLERSDREDRSERSHRSSRGSRGDRPSGRRDRVERIRPEVRDDLVREPILEPVTDDDWSEIPLAAELDVELLDGDQEVSLEARDDADGSKRRRRRRGRRGRKITDDVGDDEPMDDVASGRQAYGQHMSDDEEDDVASERITKITSWLDAISPMIEANMENHRKTQHHDHRGRGGQRGNQRRRGGSRPSGH